jgi:hypothetical protein
MKYLGDDELRIGGQFTLFIIIPAIKFALTSGLPVEYNLNFTDSMFISATTIIAFDLLIKILSNYFDV